MPKKKTRRMTQLGNGLINEEAVSRETTEAGTKAAKPKKPKFFLVPQETMGMVVLAVRAVVLEPSNPDGLRRLRKAEESLLEVVNSTPVSRETKRKAAKHGASTKQRKSSVP